MHVTLVDDSIPFDGFSPATRALGGAEKAFASLAGALVRCGADVHVYNRARFPMMIEGAQWETMERSYPTQTDLLIAFRKPSLLGAVRLAGKRMLWVTASARQLEPARKAIDGFRPGLAFLGVTQKAAWRNAEDLPTRVIQPGLRQDFLADSPTTPGERPTAIFTTHPAHGLDWILDCWRELILAAVPNARLVVVSALMDRGRAGGDIADDLKPVLAKALATPNLEIVPPTGDGGMADLYRSARVHLYPGHPDDMACWTLMESQACGLPAVARALGAVHERIRDGETGHIVPDETAFANVAIRFLKDDQAFWATNQAARLTQRSRNWTDVGTEFLAFAAAQR